jgi:hypothetical protein
MILYLPPQTPETRRRALIKSATDLARPRPDAQTTRECIARLLKKAGNLFLVLAALAFSCAVWAYAATKI